MRKKKHCTITKWKFDLNVLYKKKNLNYKNFNRKNRLRKCSILTSKYVFVFSLGNAGVEWKELSNNVTFEDYYFAIEMKKQKLNAKFTKTNNI